MGSMASPCSAHTRKLAGGPNRWANLGWSTDDINHTHAHVPHPHSATATNLKAAHPKAKSAAQTR
jgi:hypothetical protein